MCSLRLFIVVLQENCLHVVYMCRSRTYVRVIRAFYVRVIRACNTCAQQSETLLNRSVGLGSCLVKIPGLFCDHARSKIRPLYDILV